MKNAIPVQIIEGFYVGGLRETTGRQKKGK
jgi:hypothetical protein